MASQDAGGSHSEVEVGKSGGKVEDKDDPLEVAKLVMYLPNYHPSQQPYHSTNESYPLCLLLFHVIRKKRMFQEKVLSKKEEKEIK